MNAVTAKIASTKMDTLLQIMRAVNIFNGLLLGLACVYAFTIIEGNVTRFFLAVYIGLFALLLLAFEFRLKRFEDTIRRFFGFMFTYMGRTMFLLFLGAINFGMVSDDNKGKDGRTVVICVGIATVFNAVFNCVVICNHPSFREEKKREMTREEIIAYIQENPEVAEQAIREADFKKQQAQASASEPVSGFSAPAAPAPAPVSAATFEGAVDETSIDVFATTTTADQPATAAYTPPVAAPAPAPAPAPPAPLSSQTRGTKLPPPLPARNKRSPSPAPAPAAAEENPFAAEDNPFAD